VVRLWVHESERVLRDRLVSEADMLKFGEFRDAVFRKHFADLPVVRSAGRVAQQTATAAAS